MPAQTKPVSADELMESWRGRLRELRRRSGYSMRDLGERLGKSPSTIWEWERKGGTEPSLTDWARIGAIYSVCPGWIAFANHAPREVEYPGPAMPEPFGEDPSPALDAVP